MYRQKTLMVNSEQKELIDNKDISTVSVNVGGYMGTESSWNHVNDISLEEKGRSLFLKVISIISIVEGSIVGIFFILLMLTLLLDFNSSILLCILAGILVTNTSLFHCRKYSFIKIDCWLSTSR